MEQVTMLLAVAGGLLLLSRRCFRGWSQDTWRCIHSAFHPTISGYLDIMCEPKVAILRRDCHQARVSLAASEAKARRRVVVASRPRFPAALKAIARPRETATGPCYSLCTTSSLATHPATPCNRAITSTAAIHHQRAKPRIATASANPRVTCRCLLARSIALANTE